MFDNSDRLWVFEDFRVDRNLPKFQRPKAKRASVYGRWLDQSRRFLLAKKVKLLEEIPEEKRTLVESIVFIMAMDLLANDLRDDNDIFNFLRS